MLRESRTSIIPLYAQKYRESLKEGPYSQSWVPETWALLVLDTFSHPEKLKVACTWLEAQQEKERQHYEKAHSYSFLSLDESYR